MMSIYYKESFIYIWRERERESCETLHCVPSPLPSNDFLRVECPVPILQPILTDAASRGASTAYKDSGQHPLTWTEKTGIFTGTVFSQIQGICCTNTVTCLCYMMIRYCCKTDFCVINTLLFLLLLASNDSNASLVENIRCMNNNRFSVSLCSTLFFVCFKAAFLEFHIKHIE